VIALPRLSLGAHFGRALPPRTAPIVLIGGVSGSGKGHLAKAIGRKLGVARVLSSDAVREVLRSVLPACREPVLHCSSFLAGEVFDSGADRPGARLIAGFKHQAALLAPALKAVVERHRREGEGLIVEGVHLTPEVLKSLQALGAIPLVVVRSRDEHQLRFRRRSVGTSGRRPAEPYVCHFRSIRRLQAHLLAEAAALGLPVVASDDPGALQRALQFVKAGIFEARGDAALGRGPLWAAGTLLGAANR
jgi:2-phosphoglycerate kinase